MAQTQKLKDATVAIQTGAYQQALMNLEGLLMANANNAQAVLHRATVYTLMHNNEKAEEDLKTFFTLAPDWVKNDAVLSGWLKKYPDVGQAKTRFFYLKKRLLVYYKEPHHTEPIQAVILHNFNVELKSNLKFLVSLPHHKYLLEAETEKDKENWTLALHDVQSDDKTIQLVPFRSKSVASSSPSASAAKAAAGRDEGDYLYKRGGKNPAWKLRWCVVRGTVLYYYESREDKEPKGSMELRNCKVMLVSEKPVDGKPHKFKFVVQPPDRRTLFMYAEKEETRKRWVAKIQAAINHTVEVKARPDRPAQPAPEAPSFASDGSVEKADDSEGDEGGTFEGGKVPKDSQRRVMLSNRSGKKDGRATLAITEEDLGHVRNASRNDDSDTNTINMLVSPTPGSASYMSGGHLSYESEEKKRDQEAILRGKQNTFGFGVGAEEDDDDSDYIADGNGASESGCALQ